MLKIVCNKIALCMVTIVLCIMFFQVSVFAEEPVKIRVMAGYDGIIKMGYWAPVEVEIINNGPDIDGELQIKVRNVDDSTATLYTAPAVVPKGTTKKITIYVLPAMQKRFLTVELVQDGKLIKNEMSSAIRYLYVEDIVNGILADDKNTLSYLSLLNMNTMGRRIRNINLSSNNFPQQSDYLSAMNLITLNSFDTSQLSKKQILALIKWVQDGGMLIVGGGPNWKKTFSALPDDVLPVEVTGTRNINSLHSLENMTKKNLNATQQFTICEGKSREGKVLFQDAGTPIIVNKEYGKGNILYFAYDLALEPFVNWAGNSILWDFLLTNRFGSVQVDSYTQSGTIKLNQMVNGVLQNIPAMQLPSAFMLFGIILLYILLVGPLNYLILKRYDRREWAWWTIPGIVVICSLGIFGIGFAGKGNNIISNSISILSLDQKSPVVELESYIGVFAPSHKNYKVEIPGDAILIPATENYYYGLYGSASYQREAKVVQKIQAGRNNSIEFYDVGMWTMRGFGVKKQIPNPGKIDGEFYIKDKKIVGYLINNTNMTIEDAIVFTENDYNVIGNISPGQKVKVEIPVKMASNTYKGGPVPIFRAYDLGGQIPKLSPEELQKRNQRRAIIEAAINYNGYGLPNNKALYFIGWNQTPLYEVRVNGEQPKQFNTVLLQSSFDIDLQPRGEFEIPPGILYAQLESIAARGYSKDMLHSYYVDSGEAIFKLELPFDRNISISEIKLQGQPLSSVRAYLYNFSKGQWDELQNANVVYSITDYPSYLENGKTLKVKLVMPNNSGGPIVAPTVALKGRAE